MSGNPGSVGSAAAIPVVEENAGRRWAVIGLLSLGMIIAYASRSNLSVALFRGRRRSGGCRNVPKWNKVGREARCDPPVNPCIKIVARPDRVDVRADHLDVVAPQDT